MTVAKELKAIAQAQKLQNEVLKEQIEILKAFSEFEDERFNSNYQKAVRTASLQRKMLLNDALAANGINFMMGDHNNTNKPPEQSRIR
jgi:ribosomal protein S19E (S16A)